VEALKFTSAARSAPRRSAWIAGGRAWTFGEAGEAVDRAVEALRAEGVGPGSRVAFRAEASAEVILALHAVNSCGATSVPLHPRHTAAERAAAIAAAGAGSAQRVVVLDEKDVRSLTRQRGRKGRALRVGAPASVPGVANGATRLPPPFVILSTSGTSEKPKSVCLPGRAFVASARALESQVPFAPRERWLLCMPLAHVGGLSILTRCLIARRTVVVEPGFDPPRVLASIRSQRITRLSVVPTMLDALLASDVRGSEALGRLSLLLVGGAACPAPLLEECERRGIRARATYGLTEACSQVTMQRPGGSGCGPALPGVELKIASDSGSALGAGVDGRILVRGKTMMTGYLGAPPLGDAWFDTGDLGRLDDSGNLSVFARRSDLIVTGGENVSPAEVERALERCHGVRAALVFGVPDPRWGQIVAAAIVADPKRPPDRARISGELATSLAAFKHPRQVCFVDALPALPSGKPDRPRAAEMLLRAMRRPISLPPGPAEA
jgi:O-succinylbenzoic acid--CoA ligase